MTINVPISAYGSVIYLVIIITTKLQSKENMSSLLYDETINVPDMKFGTCISLTFPVINERNFE